MFLKHRRRWTVLLGLLSALCLTLGITAIEWRGQLERGMTDGENTEEMETSVAEAEETFETVVSTKAPETDVSSEEFSPAYPVPAFASAGGERLLAWVSVFGFGLGAVFGVPFLFLLRPSLPALGPELALGFLILGQGLFAVSGRIGIWSVQTAARGILILLILVCLREFAGWICRGCSLNWSTFHRAGIALAGRTDRQSLYLLVQMAMCMAGTVSGIYGISRGGRFLLWGIAGIFTAVLCFLSLWQLTRQVEHLSQQVTRLHEGLSVDPGKGMFEETEKELADLVNQRDEAVKEAVSSERFKVELISNVSHDLRTPLTAILGYGELLEREKGMSEEGKRQLLLLNQKTGYMRDLVESLFELTKVSSGAEKSRMQKIDLIRLLEQTFGLFDDKLQAAGLQVRRHYPCEHLPIVTDGARMHQVFANLVGNAIKYALPNSRIHAEVCEEEDVCQIRITNVASYEMDFSPEEIVERFARGDKARSTQGSGIGLAIAQTYTESVGGKFHVEIDGEQFSAIVRLPNLKEI